MSPTLTLSTCCPQCRSTAFILCEGGCYKDHRHHARCIKCGRGWRCRTRVLTAACRRCGDVGRFSEDDPSPGICAPCNHHLLWAFTLEFAQYGELWGSFAMIEYLRLKLIEDAGVSEDWAEALATRVAQGKPLSEP